MTTEPPKPTGTIGGSGGPVNAGGSSASRVQMLWGEVVSEFVSDTLLMMTGYSKDYVDRVHEALVRLSRLHVLFPRHLRHSGRLAIAAAFRRLRPVETCTVVQHFHARLSHLLDSLRSDDELGVTATRTRQGLTSEICEVLRELDLGEGNNVFKVALTISCYETPVNEPQRPLLPHHVPPQLLCRFSKRTLASGSCATVRSLSTWRARPSEKSIQANEWASLLAPCYET